MAAGRYDAKWYRYIAENGYTIGGAYAGAVGFYPGYPALSRVLAAAVPDFRVALLLVANLSAAVACVALYRLYRPRLGPATAAAGTCILLTAPDAIFLGLGFSESAFLAAVALTFLFAERRFWVVAGIAGAVACLIRFNGALLAIPLLIAAYRSGAWRRPAAVFAGGLVFALGAAAYVAYLGLAFGNPLFYEQVQAQHWHHHLVDPLQPVLLGEHRAEQASIALAAAHSEPLVRLVDAATVLTDGAMILVAAGTLVLGWRRLPPEEWIWVLLVLLPPLLVFDVPDSISRYLLAAFPIYFLAARLLQRVPVAWWGLAAVGLAFQGELAFRLAQGWFVA